MSSTRSLWDRGIGFRLLPLLGGVGAVLACSLLVYGWITPRFTYPLDYAATLHGIDREFTIIKTAENLHPATRPLLLFAWGRLLASSRRVATQANKELLNRLKLDESPRSTLKRNLLAGNLAILWLEQGRDDDAKELLANLRGAVIAMVIQHAYFGEARRIPRFDLDLLLPMESTRQAVKIKLAERSGDLQAADAFRDTLERRAFSFVAPLMMARLLLLFVACSGAALVVAQAVRKRKVKVTAIGAPEVPWSIVDGLSIFVIAIICSWGLIFAARFVGVNRDVSEIIGQIGWSIILLALIGIALRQSPHALLDLPLGVRGLLRRTDIWFGWAGILIIVDILGQWILGRILVSAGFNPHWSQSLDPYWITVPMLTIVIQYMNISIVGPAAEELAFRGLLFPSLRKAGGLVFAIVGSAAIFAIVHPGRPIADLARALLLGIVLAIGYERTRSLVPVIICHGIHNLWPAVEAILRYR